MKASSQSSLPIKNTIYKIKTNLEKIPNVMSKKPQRLYKRGRQPYNQKLKYFPQEDSLQNSYTQINLIPKRNRRSKNKSSSKLFIKNFSKIEEKKICEENESDSDYSNSVSRDFKKSKVLGEYKNSNIYNYPTRKDVGLISSEEENSSDNSIIEENFGMEIERILIEIYNKNISNIHNNKKCKNEINKAIPGEEHLKSNFEKYDEKCNFVILKVLSTKIKELIQKYKEKIYEIQEIKEIYDQQRAAINCSKRDKVISPSNKSDSNRKTKSDSSSQSHSKGNNFSLFELSDSIQISKQLQKKFKNSNIGNQNKNSISYENLISNSKMLLQVKHELIEYGIPKTLLRELKNIKHTLIISSPEIENVFEYPLSLLKDENGALVHFSFEKMQLEEFWKILLKDEFISNLITQIKILNSQLKLMEITELLNQVDEDLSLQNEMAKFDEFINNKLKYDNSSVINNSSTSGFLRECNNEISAKVFTLTSASSVESICDRNEINNNIADLDELVKYINEDNENKKTKKNKRGKNKKNNNNSAKSSNNKQKCDNILDGYREQSSNIIEKLNELASKSCGSTNSEEENNDENIYITDKDVEDFKRELESFAIPAYMGQKIIPNISEEFLKKLDLEILRKKSD